ncbi:MAG: helix-hairpin-helix domain-containing protein [Bacteroidales bacterium]|nr:helix-hairpin-helix domain-containing protein [Bacteroidales bacterium]
MQNLLNKLNNSLINNLSAKDKHHIWFILGIIASLIVINAVVSVIRPPVSDISQISDADSLMQQRLAALDSMYRNMEEADTLSRLDSYIIKRYDTIALFAFDPNTATREQLLRLGLTGKQAGNLLKYRENGGRFTEPDDFRKMYGIRSMQYRILKPFIQIAEARTSTAASGKGRKDKASDKQNKAEEKSIEYFDFDPNSISADDFMKLGFSQKQAQSFVNYREKGKKFYVPDDITDAYCVDGKAYERIKKYIKINLDSLTDGGKIRDLNTIDRQGLVDLGLSDSEAGEIIEFRQKAGFYYAPWQIADVIGSKRGNKLKSLFYVCRSVERKLLNINTATAEEMAENPYIKEDKAAKIVALRDEIGKLEARHLVEMNVFGEQEMKRVSNYIIY